MKFTFSKYKILFGIFLLFAVFSAYTFIQDTDKQKMQMALVLSALLQNHYDAPEINDAYSKKVFVSFLDQLDHSKRFLTQEDSMAVASFQNQLDNEVHDQEYRFFEKINELYERKLTMLATSFQAYLAQPFDFSTKEAIQLDADKRSFAKNDAELKEQWRQYLKYLVMIDVQSKLDKQEKAIAEKDTSVKVKTFEVYEKEARERILKDHNEMFKRLQKETKADRFADFVNAHVHVFDPHSDFFPPKEKENFDIVMSGNLEGIGATLQEKDGYIKVMSIVPGSPSYKQGELKPDDLIMKVAQGDNEPVDIVDMRLDNAVKLIRGKKGTTVKLTVKKPSGIIKVISIVRDVVVMEESYAKSYLVVEEQSKARVGYIHLPSFYVDFNNVNARSCSKDIKIELAKLASEGVDGIILDLRNNGGGSLSDVVTIGGYFIDQGPIVQVKGKEGLPEVLADRTPGINYNGPLVILVNQFSASASEILAAAMQDYKRAVIIGSTATYGKGTVQRFFDLPTLEGNEPVGAAKITTHKFYRIDGGSTQLKGVVPDIILPDVYANLGIGEKEMDYAMPWDKTIASTYDAWMGKKIDMQKIKTNSQQRIDQSEAFKKIRQNAVYLKSKQDNTRYTLNLQEYKETLVKNKKEEEIFNEEYKPIAGWDFSVLKADRAQLDDSTKLARSNEQVKGLKKDLYIYEGVQVIRDLVK